MRNAFTFIRQSKSNPPTDDPFEGVAIGCLLILFLLIVGVFGAFVLIQRGSNRSKALEEKINSLQEKVKQERVEQPDQRAALQEVYPFPDSGYGVILR